jgi:hypothetical protein
MNYMNVVVSMSNHNRRSYILGDVLDDGSSYVLSDILNDRGANVLNGRILRNFMLDSVILHI